MEAERVVVIGLGRSGKSVARFLAQKGVRVLGVDSSLQALCSCPYVHESYLESDEFPSQVDYVVRSPGVPLGHPWVIAANAAQIPVMTDIQLAFQTKKFLENKSFGITGTVGKTTTVLFLEYLLRKAGIQSFAMGNVGIPILEGMQNPGVRIIEISSFQLADQRDVYPVLSGGMILNISDNHLDYHGSFSEYCKAKQNLALCMQNPENLWVGDQRFGKRVYWEEVQKSMDLLDKESALKPLYLHDKYNYCCAYLLAQAEFPIAKSLFIEAVATFKKPPHRMEYLGERGGVHYINDSKATTVSATEKALLSIGSRAIVILGGRNKGYTFSALLPALRRAAKRVIAMGESAPEIARDLEGFPVTVVRDLQEALLCAEEQAVPGDIVVLSPACASFDQFRSYEERGAIFKQLVGMEEVLL
ncbi:UDP-N-acetylmuramoylalanine--D-glutamate ligase,UDP-N-acetylmuramoylalanine--D-glutamate ligase,UDP-N-acetylmuramoyl-L-alanyl-D-glutamate synthetase,UDP-N-acetylmuramoylalanine--D-glutamate ligase,Mur ligase middle domain [Chlamydia suis]|uniref:UDP-N-acetylmuramoyl-L-alanine--D-glutamate ligase n=1 Tax=Chlamydia suis TaxID=83559 RepID=UPI0009AF35B6|nr:UDP-N-acetylmuramoyl-L-alanine--D-glutamate ligase [Chlamydia suis]SIU03810.1 UDP-N-acetylmuramoylalanine--D-glutamate ligase,UDP-N-acetylmuramoylalanine--D-glutamate ligase,UDP-N-acetylmuramoyl-L-alanyl-D-glutamate synthetase,UDP-N-acetylmuramoylalanine--D-glutamate ligase,Mur ligase middle domain [Chlamydia suis]